MQTAARRESQRRYRQKPEVLARERERARRNRPKAQWRLRHPEKACEESARRRARIQGATVGVVSYQRVWERDEGVCHLCGEAVEPEALEYDHVVPLVGGGEHSEANVAVSHAACNRRKGASMPAVAHA